MSPSGGTERARDQVTRMVRDSLKDPRIGGWFNRQLSRHRRADLPTFLASLAATEPDVVLADEAGRLDAHLHLATQWRQTVHVVARPDTLPVVVEHRERVRVHPAAPAGTAVLASLGTASVMAATSGGVEVLSVAGVATGAALVGWGLCRPRARRHDRRYTVTGSPAVVARAEAELAEVGLLALGSGDGGLDDHLGQLVGASRLLEELESEARDRGLLTRDGELIHPPQTPDEVALLDEVVGRRTEVLHALLVVSDTGRRHRAGMRAQERGAYRPSRPTSEGN